MQPVASWEVHCYSLLDCARSRLMQFILKVPKKFVPEFNVEIHGWVPTTPKPWRCPRILATHPPARHSSPHQAAWPACPPKRSHMSINTAHCPAKTPSPEPGTPPTDRTRQPKPGTEIQGNPNNPKRAEKPAPDKPQDPNPNLGLGGIQILIPSYRLHILPR
ncbi:hypothetical protein AMECASPLE_021549 [Ameca splendens]|uniref:Uncharacterized protein n=1 Tax=Ameca splendens TaxID=208324 RepID=A0ABV0YFN6_9TELE